MSLTRDFSVFIDLSGGRDLVNVLANVYYMHFGYFVKGYQTTNLKILLEILLDTFSTKGHPVTSTFALLFAERADGHYMRFAFFVKGFLKLNLKNCRFCFYV